MTGQSFPQFRERWRNADRSERSNYQLFLTEICALLELPRPEASGDDYVFERKVVFHNADGSHNNGFIDLYKRGSFVLEAKQTGLEVEAQGWNRAILKAHGQAQQYARALPAEEGRPPFVIVCDVGRSLDLYAEFSRSGGAYVAFPDPRSYRIRLDDLEKEEVRETLRAVWTDPLSLDPARRSARVTKAIAADLAKLAEGLESAGHAPETVAGFLMRCLFTMFAEDVGLLPKASFKGLLEECRTDPSLFVRLVPGLWRSMNHGGFSPEIRSELLRFNGGLFAEQTVLPLNSRQIDLLLEAARADWRQVEPAIFGTLLERALDPDERHTLGGHYTPRSYVERLVLPAVIEPLREEWKEAQAVASTLERQGKRNEAVRGLKGFLDRLANVRVLDPACGSGNFLYVTLEHLKRLEGEVLNTLEELGEKQQRLETTGVTVDPHQMLGLESNPRAARIAEAVLWIGFLQWHYRTRGDVNPPEPVLKDYRNIECRDAVLAWDRVDFVTDETGRPVTRWDGRTYKKHPLTGEDVPDEKAQAAVVRYVNPRKAEWPEAEFVVGNPPFIGAGPMRQTLGDGYVEALRKTYSELPESTDYVLYWWHVAAERARAGKIRRFGLITTNSLRQTFNRRVVQMHLEAKEPLSLVFAVPDHPWVDSADGAQVRIAMTAAEAGDRIGELRTVVSESFGDGEGREVQFAVQAGKLHADLRAGANVSAVVALRANGDISSPGVKLHGAGFIVDDEQAARLGLGRILGLEKHIRDYRNGRDITRKPRGVKVIDLFGLSAEEVQDRFPEVYQWVLERVKPERSAKGHTKDGAGYAKFWWLFGKPRQELRRYLAGLDRYISTVETSKHRFFVFLVKTILPDNKLVAIGMDDGYSIGILSSRVHVLWSLATGSRLGVGNDPVYVKSRCFETFPFPATEESSSAHIGQLAERLDLHRKTRQELYPELTITDLYNVLESIRLGDRLLTKDREVHEQGLASLLAELHDELDRAVLDAYGWADLAPALAGKPGGTTPCLRKSAEQEGAEEELLGRLVALNVERAAEEADGRVRWLRPEFQAPEEAREASQQRLIQEEKDAPVAVGAGGPRPWPKALTEQVRAVRAALSEQRGPVGADAMAKAFKGAKRARVEELLRTLAELGQARVTEDGRYAG